MIIFVLLCEIIYGLGAIGIIDLDKRAEEEKERRTVEEEKKIAEDEERERKKQEDINVKRQAIDDLFAQENLGYDLAFNKLQPVMVD